MTQGIPIRTGLDAEPSDARTSATRGGAYAQTPGITDLLVSGEAAKLPHGSQVRVSSADISSAATRPARMRKEPNYLADDARQTNCYCIRSGDRSMNYKTVYEYFACGKQLTGPRSMKYHLLA